MARLAKIVSNQKKRKLIDRHAVKRAELRKKVKNAELSDEERTEAMFALQRLPKNSCAARYRNRCGLTGRPRAFYRAFGLSRIQFRELALRGMIPGVTKSSW